MDTNETKKPIGFDMELTDEELKQVAGGNDDPLTLATYRCPVCNHFETVCDNSPSNHLVHKHTSPEGMACENVMILFKIHLIPRGH